VLNILSSALGRIKKDYAWKMFSTHSLLKITALVKKEIYLSCFYRLRARSPFSLIRLAGIIILVLSRSLFQQHVLLLLFWG
jgi:hypothetical protein